MEDSSDDDAALQLTHKHFIHSAKKHTLSPAKKRSKHLKSKQHKGRGCCLSSPIKIDE
jgi:hypothetical protein